MQEKEDDDMDVSNGCDSKEVSDRKSILGGTQRTFHLKTFGPEKGCDFFPLLNMKGNY